MESSFLVIIRKNFSLVLIMATNYPLEDSYSKRFDCQPLILAFSSYIVILFKDNFLVIDIP